MFGVTGEGEGEALTFGVLGPLVVHRGAEPVDLTAPRERTVLAALVRCAGSVVTRDQLITDVWGDAPPPSAVATLHSYLAQLRRRLAPDTGDQGFTVLERTGTGYRLAVPPDAVDAVELERRSEAGRRAWADGRVDESADELARATALWRGRPYPELGDSPVIAGEVARLENLWLSAVEDRVRAELAQGPREQLVGELESLVAQHPFRETLWAHLIVALYRMGRQADALRAFQRLRVHLVEELGIEPGPQLRRLELAVLRHDRTLDGDRAAAVPGNGAEPGRGAGRRPAAGAPIPRRVPPEETGIVGRDAELQRLAAAWAGACAGGPAVVIVVGEPGAGVSRLLRAFAGTVADAAVVASARCRSGGPGLATVRTLARQILAPLSDDEVLRVVGPFAPQLGALGPDLAARVSAGADAPGRHRRPAVIDAAAHLVEQVARAMPVAIVLDDADRLDASTAALLAEVADREGAPVLVVLGTHAPAPGALSDRVDHLTGLGTTTRLELVGLDADAVARLWTAERNEPADRSGAEAVRAYTAGNPQLVTGLARAGWSPGDPPPRAVVDQVSARLARLPARAAAAVEVASAAGAQFDLRVLAGASRRTIDELLPTVETLLAEGLFEEIPGRSGQLRFHHPVVHEAVYAGLSAARRALLHDRLADHLVAARTDPDIVAHHALRAIGIGDTPRALASSIRAARAALDELAVGHAVALLHDALAAVEDEPSTAGARAELLAELAWAQRAAGDLEGANANASEAAAAARGLGRPDVLALATLTMVAADGLGGLDPSGAGLCAEALTGLGDDHDELRAQLLGHLGVYRAVVDGDQRAAEALVAEAEALARRATSPGGESASLLAVVLVQVLVVLRLSHRIDHAEAVRDELAALVRLPRSLGTWWAQAMLLRQQPVLRLVRGDAAGFTEDLASLERTAHLWALSVAPDDMARQAGLEPVLDLLRATWALGAGHLDEAATALGQLNAAAGDDPYLRASYSSVAFLLLREHDRLGELIPLLERMLAESPDAPTTAVCLAYCHLHDGDRDTARRLFTRTAPAPGMTAVGARVADDVVSATLLTEIAAELGDTSATAGLRRMLDPYQGQLLVVSTGAGCLGAADRYLGILASLDGRGDEAERHFERAVELESGAGLLLLAARTRCHQAEHLRSAGRPGAAARALQGIPAEGSSEGVVRWTARLRAGPGALPLR